MNADKKLARFETDQLFYLQPVAPGGSLIKPVGRLITPAWRGLERQAVQKNG
ncbi:MAG: hypothetical protein ABJN42_06970 [Roseibium sp.]|uniref:hypothetical protein n=1 Tax=Roseibium sp. TaxID=1936156 RepID=UPI003296FB96